MLILLALLFFAPVAVSFYLYYGAPGWGPQSGVSHGELISPARPLPEVSLPMPDGSHSDPRFLQQKWSLLFVGEGRCDKVCRNALYEMRQVRLSLGREMDRIQRVFLYTGACCEQPYFANEHSGLIIVSADTEAGGRLLERFPSYGEAPVVQAGRIYVIDPLGNLLLSYPPQTEPKGMLKDLKRLLKLSHIG